MAISRIFDIASRGLGVYQRALDVTSHNVTNSNNPDYTRQKVIFASEKSDFVVGAELGSGVKIEDIQRVKNQMLDTQLRNYNAKYSDFNKRSLIMGQVETLLSEPSDQGLSSFISGFFNSWNELAVTPNSIPLRNNVVNAAQKMTNKIQSIYQGITQAKSDIAAELVDKVKDLNSAVQEIQTLNKQIYEAKVTGQGVNDMMDQRDKDIDELSKLANINVSFDEKGNANISIGGVFAVDGYNYNQFKVDSQNGKLQVTLDDGTATAALKGGELYAMTDLYSNKLTGYQTNLDTLSQNIMDQVNSVHSQSYNLYADNTTAAPNGGNFFTSYAGGNLVINSGILSDPKNIAAAVNYQSGNGEQAIKMADLADAKSINGQTIGDFYSTLVSSIGADKQMNDQNSDSNQLVIDQLQSQKSSFSGVSIDEEMTNVIKYQRSYDASAKLIKVADETLQTLLDMV